MEKGKKPRLFFIYLATFVNIVGFGMIFPLLPFYAKHFNASEAQVGLLAATFAIAQFLFSPFWGRLSDRFGRKPIIAISLLGAAIASIGFGLSNSLFWLFAARFLQGLFSSAGLPVSQAYIADVTSKEDRIKGMSRLGAALGLGFIVGPGLGGTLSAYSIQLPFFVAAAVALINAFFVQFFLPESLSLKKEKLAIKEGFLNFKQMYHGLKGELASFFILMFLWSYALSNNEVAVPIFGAEKLNISASYIGIIFSIQGLLVTVVQLLVLTKITKILGEHKTVTLGMILMGIGLYIIPFAPIPNLMASFMIIASIGSALARPTLATLISKATKEGQGTTMGVATAFESLGRVLGPLIGGYLYYKLGFHSPFTSTAVIILLTLIFVVQIKGFLKD